MSTEVPEIRGSSSGQGEGRIDEAFLALSHILNFGDSWDKAQGWVGVRGSFTCQGNLRTAVEHRGCHGQNDKVSHLHC